MNKWEFAEEIRATALDRAYEDPAMPRLDTDIPEQAKAIYAFEAELLIAAKEFQRQYDQAVAKLQQVSR